MDLTGKSPPFSHFPARGDKVRVNMDISWRKNLKVVFQRDWGKYQEKFQGHLMENVGIIQGTILSSAEMARPMGLWDLQHCFGEAGASTWPGPICVVLGVLKSWQFSPFSHPSRHWTCFVPPSWSSALALPAFQFWGFWVPLSPSPHSLLLYPCCFQWFFFSHLSKPLVRSLLASESLAEKNRQTVHYYRL